MLRIENLRKLYRTGDEALQDVSSWRPNIFLAMSASGHSAMPTTTSAGPRASKATGALGGLALVALFAFCWKVMTKDTIWSFISDVSEWVSARVRHAII